MTAYEMRIRDWSSDVCSSDLGDLSVNLTQMLCCDPVDRGAIATAVVRKVQQRADALDRKAKIARAANERQSRKMVLAIVAIIRFCSRRRGQQASLFIIADRFNLRGRRPPQFPDLHRSE